MKSGVKSCPHPTHRPASACTERGTHAKPCSLSRHDQMDRHLTTEEPARLLSIERVSAAPSSVAGPTRPTKKTRTPARNPRIRFTLQMSMSGAFTCANTSRKKLNHIRKKGWGRFCHRHSHRYSSACRDPSLRKKKRIDGGPQSGKSGRDDAQFHGGIFVGG